MLNEFLNADMVSKQEALNALTFEELEDCAEFFKTAASIRAAQRQQKLWTIVRQAIQDYVDEFGGIDIICDSENFSNFWDGSGIGKVGVINF